MAARGGGDVWLGIMIKQGAVGFIKRPQGKVCFVGQTHGVRGVAGCDHLRSRLGTGEVGVSGLVVSPKGVVGLRVFHNSTGAWVGAPSMFIYRPRVVCASGWGCYVGVSVWWRTVGAAEDLGRLGNKKDERGIVIKNKARLVAQGYTQDEGINCDEVFALVAKIESIRLFLAYASFKDFVVYQIDVKSTFVYGKIEEEVYRGKIDKTLFIRRVKSDILLVQVYVDDIIFGSTKKSLCIKFEKMMHKKFQMSSMGELTFFLVLQVKQKEDGILISQDKYVTKILKKFGFTGVKTASTPMETHKPLLKDADGEHDWITNVTYFFKT
ncbi:retrovirus-related pol polyprotein from transposon TNT 1-94 [Tanacetum coccineum]